MPSQTLFTDKYRFCTQFCSRVGLPVNKRSRSIQGMYKGLEPIRLQHSVWTEYCFRSPSEICPKFPKFPNFVGSSSIVFIEILLIFDNLSYFGVFF